jgi:hypothetical protein
MGLSSIDYIGFILACVILPTIQGAITASFLGVVLRAFTKVFYKVHVRYKTAYLASFLSYVSVIPFFYVLSYLNLDRPVLIAITFCCLFLFGLFSTGLIAQRMIGYEAAQQRRFFLLGTIITIINFVITFVFISIRVTFILRN